MFVIRIFYAVHIEKNREVTEGEHVQLGERSVSLSVCQSVSLSVCQYVSLSVCQPVSLKLPSACQSACLPVSLSLSVPVH